METYGLKNLTNEEKNAIKKFETIFTIAKEFKHEYVKPVEILKKRVPLINKAFYFAFKCHRGQRREDGSLFITHPIEVSIILVKMGFRGITIAGGLLHDVIEYGKDVTLNKVKEIFGERIAILVKGLTALHTKPMSLEDKDALNIVDFVKNVLVKKNIDIRIFFIKIADRLHNLRTLSALSPNRMQIKALETIEIYGPLARRLGLYEVSCELEDLAFSYLNPEEHQNLKSKIDIIKIDFEKVIKSIEKQLEPLFSRVSIKEAIIDYRIKHLWSIFNKLKKQKCSLKDLTDIVAMRIIVKDEIECWKVFSVIASNWHINYWNNYIDHPKVNGYQSIHININIPAKISKLIKCVEIQIRTPKMQEIAEYGSAAHWRYSHNDKEWLQLLHIEDLKSELKKLGLKLSPIEFKHKMQNLLNQDYINVRTPKGDSVLLPMGATPIDFAYKVNNNLGHYCIGAEVEGTKVPLNYNINQEGVRINIIKGEQKAPKEEWLNYVKTNTAKYEIKKFLNTNQGKIDNEQLPKSEITLND